MRLLKQAGLTFLALPLIVKSFHKTQAKIWLKRVYRDRKYTEDISRRQKRWAHKKGFLSIYVDDFGLTNDNYKNFISEKDYRYLQPLNEKYNKWLEDKISILNTFKPFLSIFPESYYHFYQRDGQWRIIPLAGMKNKNENSKDDIIALIKKKGVIALSSTISNRKYKISYDGTSFYLNDVQIELPELTDFIFLKRSNRSSIITEYIEPHTSFFDASTQKTRIVRINIMNPEGDNPVISDAFIVEKNLLHSVTEEFSKDKEETDVEGSTDSERIGFFWHPIDLKDGSFSYLNQHGEQISGTLPDHQKLKSLVRELGLFVPEIEFMGADVIITDDAIKFEWLMPEPYFPKKTPFSQMTTGYLNVKLDEKRREFSKGKLKRSTVFLWKNSRKLIVKKFILFTFPKGLNNYVRGTLWLGDVWSDFRNNKSATFKEKAWAYRHGFLSYRLEQYGITPDNYEDYISDLEYKWARHLNSTKYRQWFQDKITIKYILSEFKECFPAYYYHISLKNGRNKIIPMMDLPVEYGASYEGIFDLVKEKKILALKPDEGSQGTGFYKLTYEDTHFYLNDEIATKEEIVNLLEDVKNRYLITEYIQMHPIIKRIYPGAVSTLRVIVFKKDGINPVIGTAYMRVGTSKTGGVDNMHAGGMAVQVDVESGRFFNARMLEDNNIVPCEHHPDTGVKIEGILPNWEKAKEQILAMAKSLSQLEYLGFDLAITEDGIKIPEINRAPGYPKVADFSDETMDYLLYKLYKKKEAMGFTKKMPYSMIKLPKRHRRIDEVSSDG